MASASKARHSSLAPSLQLLLFICSVLLLPTTSTSESNKVSVDLYYETLCPDSYDFIVKHLIKLFDTGIISAVDLNLVPYGNAKLGPNNTITCQDFATGKQTNSYYLIIEPHQPPINCVIL